MAPTPDDWGGIALRRHSCDANPYSEVRENSGDLHILSLPLCRGATRLESEGRVLHDGEVLPGMLRITSPGETIRMHRRSAAEAMIVSIPGPLFRHVATEQGRASPGARLAPIVTPMPGIARLASSLTDVATIDAAHRKLFVSGVTIALLAIAFGARDDVESRRGLDPARLARCVDYAEARLGGRIDLATWAGEVGLPVGEFARRFQASTGLAPYAWLLEARVEQAKRLLADRDAALASVALEVGFCSQSHFTDAFRRRTGLSPGRWRRLRLP